MLEEKVLVIDDDKLVRNIVCRALSDIFQTVTAENGEEGIQKASLEKPDFILLDVEMPGMNGYEVCDQLRQEPSFPNIPIIFLSSRGGLRERMQGYEVGATDYLVKPFESEELVAKLKMLGQLRREKEVLSNKAASASETALLAMRGSSEMGLAIQFIEATYLSGDFSTISHRFFDVTSQLGLNCTLMFNTRSERLFFTPSGNISPLEKEVIDTLYTSGKRFNDFGCRTQINYSRVALLIKNMPLNNPEAYGRLKDFLPTMLGSTDSKIKALDTEKALEDQTRNLNQSFNVVRDTLIKVGENLQNTQGEVMRLLRSTLDQLESRIPTLGLEEDQEKYFIGTLDDALQSTHTIIESGESASLAFQNVCRLLDHLSERQQVLLQQITEDEGPSSQHLGGASEDAEISGDVELF